MNRLINNIIVENYRGFKEMQEIKFSEYGQVTFLVGANNSGKSLISRLFSLFSFDIDSGGEIVFKVNHITDYDFHNMDTDIPIKIWFGINQSIISGSKNPNIVKLKSLKNIYLYIEIIRYNNEFYWMLCLSDGENISHSLKIDDYDIGVRYNSGFWTNNSVQTYSSSRDLYKEIQKNLLIFDPIRAFDRSVNNSFLKSGIELVNWIKSNENPGEIKKTKQAVANFLKNEFNLEPPVEISCNEGFQGLRFTFSDGMNLSSNEVGTGYTMLYILLMEIHRNSRKIVIIDEIESHLQPGLTKMLMQVVKSQYKVQFIVATHSPAVMETSTENDFLYRFQKDECACTVEGFFRNFNSGENADAKILREVCNELGVIPGDALLSNCVIWVEGPSEIFWLRAWIKSYFKIYKKEKRIEKNLIEGLHYSILMTGGGNISNYSFSEEEIYEDSIEEDDRLKVLRVNPNPIVIIDSDNSDQNSKKYSRMINIAKEVNNQNKLNYNLKDKVIEDDIMIEGKISEIPNLWILKGRELENYCHPKLLKDFYVTRSTSSKSIIEGVSSCSNWDVFSTSEGIGKILESRGITNVSEKSGTIKHKIPLAKYVFNNFNENYFEKDFSDDLKPNSEMIDDLIFNLGKILDYIVKINNIK